MTPSSFYLFLSITVALLVGFVLIGLLAHFLFRHVLGLCGYVASAASSLMGSLSDSYQEALENYERSRRKRELKKTLQPPRRSRRPDRDQAKRLEEARQFEYAIKRLRDLMASCSLCHVVTAEAYELVHLGELRSHYDCYTRRLGIDELRECVLEMIGGHRAAVDPDFSVNALIVSLTSGLCGPDRCCLLKLETAASPHPCTAAKLLGYKLGEEDAFGVRLDEY